MKHIARVQLAYGILICHLFNKAIHSAGYILSNDTLVSKSQFPEAVEKRK